MSYYSSSLLTTLKTLPQRSKFYLFVQSGEYMWTGQVTAVTTLADASQVITTNTLSGDKTVLEPYLTAWIGNSTDSKYKGNIRILDPHPSGDMSKMWLAPNNNNIAIGDRVSVDRVLRPFGINPNSLNTQYHDYTDTPTIAAPQSNVGPDRFAWTGENVYLEGDFSWAQIGHALASHAWSFENKGTVQNPGQLAGGGTAANPIIVTFALPGDVLMKHRVADDTGAIHDAYRIVMVRDRPTAASPTLTPYTDFEVTGFEGTWESGGWKADIKVLGGADPTLFPDGASVVIVAEDWYDTTQTSIGPWAYLEPILISGHIIKGSTKANIDRGEVTFSVAGWQEWMKNLYQWPASFAPMSSTNAGHNNPNGWTITQLMYHMLNYHSNIGHLADVFALGLDVRVDYYDTTEGKLWDQVSQLMSARGGLPCFSRYNQLYLQMNVNYMTLAEHDVIGGARFDFDTSWWYDLDLGDELQQAKTAQVDFIGVAIGTYDSNHNFIPDSTALPTATDIGKLYALAPYVQGSFGDIAKIEGFFVADQNEAILRAYQAYYEANRRFPLVTLTTWNMRVLEPASQDYATITLGQNDTLRAWVWAAKEFVCRRATYDIKAAEGYITVQYGFQDSIWGSDNIAGHFTPPASSPPPGPAGYGARTGQSVLACWKYGVVQCTNLFAPGGASWVDKTGDMTAALGRTANTAPRINGVCRDVYDPTNTWYCWGHRGIFKTTNQGANWTVLYNKATHQYYTNCTDDEVSTFSVVRVRPIFTPRGLQLALILTKNPVGGAGYSKLWLACTSDNWQSVNYVIAVAGDAAITDTNNYSGPDLIDLEATYQWDKQPNMVWIATQHMGNDTVQLFRSLDGGQTYTNLMAGITGTSGYPDVLTGGYTWPSRIVVPYEGNASGDLAWWMENGDRGGLALYKITHATRVSPLPVIARIPTVNGLPSFGVSVDKPLLPFWYKASRMRSIYGQPYGNFSLTRDSAVTWESRNYPNAHLAGFADFPFKTTLLYASSNQDPGTEGIFWITQDEGLTWGDATYNLNQLITIGGSNTGAGGVWSITADWTI